MGKFLKISSLDKLDAFQKVLVFKHSRSCPISLKALHEVERFMDEDPTETPIVMVDVFSEKGFSLEIATHLKLGHESPQMIYLEDGKMLWNDSHLGVTSKEISIAINS